MHQRLTRPTSTKRTTTTTTTVLLVVMSVLALLAVVVALGIAVGSVVEWVLSPHMIPD